MNTNVLSIPHRKTLYCLLEAFSAMANGTLKGRFAWGLAPGLGKSRAVIKWAAAVHIQQAPFSLVVCASRVEQLCTMKADMISAGIPEASIGLLYSGPQVTRDSKGKELRKLAFPSTEDNDSRPFFLATHARVKVNAAHMQQYHLFHETPRSLMVWDESLLISDTELFDARTLIKQLGAQLSVLPVTDGDHVDLHNWLTEWSAVLTTNFKEFVAAGLNMLPTPSFTLSLDQQTVYGERFTADGDDLLADFLKVCDQPMRLLRHGTQAVVSYSVVVPSELKNIMVLDASYAVRKLELADTTIQNAERLPACKALCDFAVDLPTTDC